MALLAIASNLIAPKRAEQQRLSWETICSSLYSTSRNARATPRAGGDAGALPFLEHSACCDKAARG